MTLPMVAQISQDQMSAAMFYLLAALTAGSAIGVVASRNIVRTAVLLLFTLLGVAGLYFLLHAEFLAAVQLVVYAGGTLILIIFGVMLTSKSPFSRFEPQPAEVLVAVVVGIIMLGGLVLGIMHTEFAELQIPIGDSYPVDQLGQALLGDYLLPFELASVLLLVVMIGAAYLAKGRRRSTDAAAPRASELSQEAKLWS
jgi:NADH-quinone oxidoreductase subunit J